MTTAAEGRRAGGVSDAVRGVLRANPGGVTKAALVSGVGEAGRSTRHVKLAVNRLRRKGEVVVERRRVTEDDASESAFVYKIGRKFAAASAPEAEEADEGARQ